MEFHSFRQRQPRFRGYFRRNEDAIKKKIGNHIDSMLCDDSQISEMDNTKNKTEAFDIDEFV